MKEKRTSHPTSIRLTDDDRELLKALVEHFKKTNVGSVSENDIMRLALRELAERKGIQVKQKGD